MSQKLYEDLKIVWKEGYKIKKIREVYPSMKGLSDDEISKLFKEIMKNELNITNCSK